MAQHYLLSSAARTLSLASVARMTDAEAADTFRMIRWAETNGEPVCPKCGGLEATKLATHPRWQCKACRHQFSVTSGTLFASHKRPIRDYLLAIAIFANGAKGHAALQLSRDLDCSYKTAFVLCHKIREAMSAEDVGAVASGEVEIDGLYAGGYVKPSNWKDNRRDRRLAKNQNGKRQVVIAIRERAGKTLTFVTKTEAAAVALIPARLAPGTKVHADEATHWDALHAHHETARINHSECYSDGEACTNQAESFFSRLRRAEIGTHHHVAGPYLAAYAAEMDWREDNRRVSNGEQYKKIATAALHQPQSAKWAGYWQRRRPVAQAAE
jgi:transposase-like protein